MPLVWAHSEYLKLLRSAADGRVFDCIPIVEQRYAKGKHPECQVEVFKVQRRQISRMPAGKTLRIINGHRFRVRWTTDGWATHQDLESTELGYLGSYADVPVAEAAAERVIFTLYWPDEDRWEGKNFEVALEA